MYFWQRGVKQILLVAVLNCFSITVSFAQISIKTTSDELTIMGIVADSTKQAELAYVTIILQEAETNKNIKSTHTKEDGSFIITDLANKQYKLTLSYVGYKTRTITFPPFTSQTINLGTIVLAPTATALEEVQVSIEKPLIVQDINKLTYNVEADPESYLLSALDMLRKVPLLTVDVNDNLQLNGTNSYQVLVNGKRSALFSSNPSEILRTLPANSIKTIEVITNPSARYEASGVGGIINIVTHKKSISGYNGSINLSAESPEGYSAGSFLTTTAGKLSASGRFNHRYSESPISRSTFFREDMVKSNKLEQTSERSSKNRSKNVSGELSYQLSPQDLITASYSQYASDNTNNYTQLVKQQNAAGELFQSYQNLNNGKGEAAGHDLSLNYEHSFKKNDQQLLTFSFNTNNSNSSSNSDFILKPLLNYTGRVSTTKNTDGTKEKTLQGDYLQPIGKQIMEIGVKSIFEESTSSYFFKTRNEETGNFTIDPSMSNSFSYRQDIHAAYASLNLSIGKWGLRTGVRLEQTELSANFKSTGTGVKKDYRNLFPSVTLSRSLRESSRINLSYNQRIERAGLYYLDPYVDQTDPLNISFGNPDLEPATSHTLQLEYSTFIKTTYFNTNAFHSFTNNSIEQVTTLGNDSVARTTFGNIGQSKNYGLTLNGNTTLFKKLTLTLNAGTTYVLYTSILEGEPQTNEGFTYNLRGAANLRFGKSWRISGNLSYNSPNILLQGSSSGYTWSSLSLNKQFLKDYKANISLHVRSPFEEKRRNLNEIINPSFYQLRESYTIIRQFSLAFNYRFGKLR